MKLVKGKGSKETGACWMSAIAWYAGQETWTDYAECVDPMIRTLCVTVNDRAADHERERLIGPHLMTPMGTRTDDPSIIQRRLERIVGFAFEQAVAALKRSGQRALAKSLAPYAGVCCKSDWAAASYAAGHAANAAGHAANAAANAASAAASAAGYAANAASYAAAASAAGYAAAASAANAASAAANAASPAAAANGRSVGDLIKLILELCAIGAKKEVVQKRSFSELVQ